MAPPDVTDDMLRSVAKGERDDSDDVELPHELPSRGEIETLIEESIASVSGVDLEAGITLDQPTDGTDGSPEPADGDALADARRVVEENDIDKFGFVTFQSKLTSQGYTKDQAQDMWKRLREEGAISGGEPPERKKQSEDGPDDDDGGGEIAADGVYLLTTTGCPGCAGAKDMLSEWIEQDKVEVMNIQESDKAADIAMEEQIMAAPSLVMEKDGEYREL